MISTLLPLLPTSTYNIVLEHRGFRKKSRVFIAERGNALKMKMLRKI